MGEVYIPTAEEKARTAEWTSSYNQWVGVQNRVSRGVAENATSFVREYPDSSPDVVAATTQGIAWHDNTISQVVAADAKQQTWLQSAFTKVVGPVSRPLLAGMWGLLDQGVARPIRHGVRMLQGESFGEAAAGSGMNLISMSRLANSQGVKTTLGQGIMPGMNPDPLMAPGGSEVLTEAMESGMSPQQAKSYTEQRMEATVGRDLFRWGQEVADSTMLHKTKDGVTQAYHATPARTAFQPFTEWITPETSPYSWITGTGDAFVQIALDPIDFPLQKFTDIARARRLAVATGAQAADLTPTQIAARHGGKAYDGVNAPAALHGGPQLEGGVLNRGGVTRSVSTARKHTPDEGFVHVFDEIPDNVRAILDEGGDVEQVFANKAVAEVFDDLEPSVLQTRSRKVAEARTQAPIAQADLHKEMGGQEGLGWMADAIDDRLDAVIEFETIQNRVIRGTKDNADAWPKGTTQTDIDRALKAYDEGDWETFSRIRGYTDAEISDFQKYQDAINAGGKTADQGAIASARMFDEAGNATERFIADGEALLGTKNPILEIDGEKLYTLDDVERWVGESFDESSAVPQKLNDYIELRRSIGRDDIFGDAASLTDEQAALVARFNLHQATGEMVFGSIEDPLKASASYSKAEMATMDKWGYFFPTREGFDDYAAHIARIEEMGAVKSRGNWLVKKNDYDRWLGSITGGKATIKWVANSGFADLYRMFPGMETSEILKMADMGEGQMDEISAIIQDWYGTASSGRKVPRRAGYAAQNAVRRGQSAGEAASILGRGNMRMSQYGRRLFAQTGNNVLDPFDFDTSFDTLVSWAHTLNVPETKLNEAAVRLAKAQNGPHEATYQAMDEMFGWLTDDLKRLGYKEKEIRMILDDYQGTVRKVQQYSGNAAATPVKLRSAPGRKIVTKYGELDIIAPEPMLDSQMGTRNIFMPSIRDARRATSRIREKMDHAVRPMRGKSSPGLSTSHTQAIVDSVLATWRNMALLRPGWIMRVIPDEMARFYAYGYSDMGQNPLAVVLMSMGAKGDMLPDGRSLEELIRTTGLGADNGLMRGPGDVPRIETSARGSNWTSQPAATQDEFGNITLTPQGRKGVARQIMQLNGAKLADALFDHATIDDAVEFLFSAEGHAIRQDIINRAGSNKSLASAASSPDAMRIHLQYVEGQRQLHTGGAYIERSADGWVDSMGAPVSTYEGREWTVKAMQDELISRGVSNSKGGPVAHTLDDLRAELLKTDGNPADLLKRPQSDEVIITRQGDERLLNLVRHGTLDDPMNPVRSYARAGRNVFRSKLGDNATRFDYVYRIDGSSKVYTDLDAAAGKLKPGQTIEVINKEELAPSAFVDGAGSKRKIDVGKYDGKVETRFTHDELKAEADTAMLDGQYDYIRDDMTRSDFMDLEDRLATAYTQEKPPVAEIRVPDKPYINADDEKALIDDMFRWIGQNPSMYGVRRPFVTLRTWELIADQYIFANKATRAELMNAAQKADMGERFSRFIDDALSTRGMKAPDSTSAASIKDITEIAWVQAVGDTKDLFYDLTKGGNWQDGARLAFPFADAWWEVLSRWTGLMNPVRHGGKPIKTARRGHQAFVGADNQGWFETNNRGERVFNIPGAGMAYNVLNPDSAVKFSPQVSFDQLTFVDFGNPSSAMKPGFSPFVQTGAAMVRPYLPTSIKPAVDNFIYGDFSPPERSFQGLTNAFLPTWIRRSFARIFEGEFDQRYASMQIHSINAMANSEIPGYEDIATNPESAQRAVLEAQQIAGWMGTVDIFTSWISPAQPQNVVELVKWDEDGNESAKSIAAMAPDYALLRGIYGQEQAIEYMLQMYGVDPLKFAPTTWAVTKAPLTRESALFLEDNVHLKEQMPYTLMAWLPPDEGEFYAEAWMQQFRDGTREKLTPTEATLYIGHVAGGHRMSNLREQRDQNLADAERQYGGKDNDGYRYVRDAVITPWYNDSVRDIYLQYWAYGPNSGITGLTSRPSYKEVVGELRGIADPNSKAYASAQAANPEVHGFVKAAMDWWASGEQASLNAGFGLQWWSTSAAESGEARAMRDAFVSNANLYLSRMSPEAREHAEWILETIFSPVLEGYDFDNPIVIAPTMASTKQLSAASKLNER